MTSKLGSIFSSDSSDADVSETDDNDDGIDLSLDKPVFLTSRGPVHMTAGLIIYIYIYIFYLVLIFFILPFIFV